MKDEEILRLYRERSETALTETERQYGALCGTIARNIHGTAHGTVSRRRSREVWRLIWDALPAIWR